mmetsp:Transcript_43838/g.66128  ORF Transcript_43838/g.66128 Transcript_43838/m.66128 type:complete len:258 (+) Transcript_43838:1-774(+)
MCSSSSGSNNFHRDNFLNDDAWLKPFLASSLKPARIIASHLFKGDKPFLDLIRHASRQSLIVYIYRDETDRLKSAIKYVVKEILCSTKKRLPNKKMPDISPQTLGLTNTEEECSFDEEPFIEQIIENRVQEIGFSVPTQLTCAVWDEINETGPNILFVHFSQLDTLQDHLASTYCPGVQSERQNAAAAESSKKYVIRLKDGKGRGEDISLNDWIDAKLQTIEFALKLSGGSCKYKTRKMEDYLSFCPSKMLQVFPEK